MSQCSHLPSSGDDHDQQVYLHPFLPTYEASSPRPCAIFFSPCEEGSSEIDHRRSPTLEQEVKEEMEEIFFSGSESIGGESGQGECKWMSSKMRFMRKMSARPRKNGLGSNNHLKKFEECGLSSDNPSSPNGSVRVCSECNTTKTPLWRSGPCGPKSLCNACGIRQRKARRAMAAALSGGLIPAAAVAPPMKARKPKKSPGACAVPFKKRFKCFSSAENKHKIHCDEITIALGKNSTLPGVFPQDEKEAAILLMALSCGLIRR